MNTSFTANILPEINESNKTNRFSILNNYIKVNRNIKQESEESTYLASFSIKLVISTGPIICQWFTSQLGIPNPSWALSMLFLNMSIVTALVTEAVVIISIAGFDYQNVSRELTTMFPSI